MTTNRPLIAVTPLMDYGRDSLWMLPGYMEAIMRAGGTPVMLPLTDDTDILAQCAERFDAFLFTGGPDVGPMVGAAASATGRSEVLSPERDRMESILLPAVMAWDKPILGHLPWHSVHQRSAARHVVAGSAKPASERYRTPYESAVRCVRT